LLSALRRFLLRETVPLAYKERAEDFTRKRKLAFPYLITLMLNLLKKKIALEIHFFYERLQLLWPEPAHKQLSSSAFCQSRQKIKPDFFRDAIHYFNHEFYTDNEQRVKLWRGRRLLAVDGSRLELPQSDSLLARYGVCFNQHGIQQPVARMSLLYDVLNKMIVDGQLGVFASGERELALLHLSEVKANDLLIYDRGYPSFDFIFEHQQKGVDVLIRTKTTWNEQIASFAASGLYSQQIELKPGKNKSLQGKAYAAATSIAIRLVRVDLPSGETEILMSTLLDEHLYPVKIFKQLYHYRWGIETRYDLLKNCFGLENFSGLSERIVLQDFYIILLIANMEALLAAEVNQDLASKYPHRKHQYQTNISSCVGLLKHRIMDLLLSQDTEKVLQQLKQTFTEHLEPIRPDRKYERKVNRYRNRQRPKNMTNRRNAI
jgi:hypothetical protein